MNNDILQSMFLEEGDPGASMTLMHVPRIRLAICRWLPALQTLLVTNISGEQK